MTVGLEEIREHLSLTDGVAEEDNAMLARLGTAALGYVEAWLGYTLADRYGGDGQPDLPEALRLAQLMLVATWYENRQSAEADRMAATPHGLDAILDSYRDWSFFA